MVTSNRILMGVVLIVFALTFYPRVASAQSEKPSQVSVQAARHITMARQAPERGHSATDSTGLIIGYGYRFNPWIGVETSYGYSRNLQNYSTFIGGTGIRSAVHQVTAGIATHFPSLERLQPYVLAGIGMLVFDPIDDITVLGGPERQVKAAFLYGAGVEVRITNQLGLRGEYRGLVYGAPDFGISTLDFKRLTHLAQPSAGIVVRF